MALRDNVVAIEATWEDGTVHDGFGFITGARGRETYIATADHVLRGDDPGQIAKTVELRLRQMPGRSYPGEVLETHEPGIDLAVLAARLPSELDWRWDALAPEPAELTFGTPVWFIGRDREWYVPADPGVVNWSAECGTRSWSTTWACGWAAPARRWWRRTGSWAWWFGTRRPIQRVRR